jgi:hypothetical protein
MEREPGPQSGLVMLPDVHRLQPAEHSKQQVECSDLDGSMHSTRALLYRDLLIASLGQLRRNCRQIAEQASGFLIGAGGEVDLR